MSQERPAVLDTSVYWHNDQSGGWLHLLPPLEGKRVLCLTPCDAVVWMLARRCAHVDRLQLDAGQPPAGLPSTYDVWSLNVGLRSLDELGRTPASAGGPYDAVVVFDLDGQLVNDQRAAAMQALIAMMDRLVAPDGVVFLALDNPNSGHAMARRLRRRRDHQAANPLSLRLLEAGLRAAGFSFGERHPLLVFGERVVEVLTPRGYRATKNRERWMERCKEVLFGPLGARHFAPAMGLLAARASRPASGLDAVSERTRQMVMPGDGRAWVVKQNLVLVGHKAILTIGPADDDRPDVITIVTGDSLTIGRRQAELQILEQLARLAPALARRIPKVHGSFALGTDFCVVMQRMGGVTLDHDLPSLDTVTAGALDFLIALHLDTAQPTTIDTAAFDRLVKPILDGACQRNPKLLEALQALEVPLRRSLDGARIPIVWMHGDFKVENTMFDPKTLECTGVIDWEHARHPGLPMLDVWYLLMYNRMLRGEDFNRTVGALLAHADYRPGELDLIERYGTALGLAAVTRPALAALFLLHHIGFRVHLHDDSEVREILRKALSDMSTLLDATMPAATARGPAAAPTLAAPAAT